MMTTRKDKSPRRPSQAGNKTPRNAAGKVLRERAGSWLLRDAKARFSEVIKRVHSEGPQRVTVRGAREVVIVAADEFRRLKGEITGQTLVEALAASPLRGVDFERVSVKAPVRDVEL
jgi:prevent-host-death family protein